MRISVVGMGKIGLPLAVQYALKGQEVLGCDINARTVRLINEGVEPFPGEAELSVLLPQVVGSGNLRATTETTEAVASSDVVVVVVPLFVDDEAVPDFAAMDAATEAVGLGLKPGTLVAYETTLPVGTTRNRLAAALASHSGLALGEDLFVVFSPERVLTGRVFADLRRYPKLVGGIDPVSEIKGVQFYETVLDFDDRPELLRPNGVWELGSSEAAEMAKLAETTYRDVNIALANQFALYAQTTGIDIAAVIEACNSQPFSHIHSPGIAVGGHCIPVYPRLYLWNDPNATVVSAARSANASAPEMWVEKLEVAAGPLAGRSCVILGAAYRGGVKETAFSGVFGVRDALEQRRAQVMVHDPMFDDVELEELGFVPYHRGSPADVLVVQADHLEYLDWTPADIPGVRAVLDGRNVLNRRIWAGIPLVSIARPPT